MIWLFLVLAVVGIIAIAYAMVEVSILCTVKNIVILLAGLLLTISGVSGIIVIEAQNSDAALKKLERQEIHCINTGGSVLDDKYCVYGKVVKVND